MVRLINDKIKALFSNQKILILIDELSFIIDNINATHYEKIKFGMNLIYLIEHYLPHMLETYIQFTLKKQKAYNLESQLKSMQKKLELVHQIIVFEATDEYQKNSNIIANKYAEFNFTYLRANQ